MHIGIMSPKFNVKCIMGRYYPINQSHKSLFIYFKHEHATGYKNNMFPFLFLFQQKEKMHQA